MKKKLCFDMYNVKMAASDANQEPAYFEFGKGEAKVRCAPAYSQKEKDKYFINQQKKKEI